MDALAIAADFWKYVAEGEGESIADSQAPILAVEFECQHRLIVLSDDQGDRRDPPTGLPTLQAALYDYLLANVGGPLIANSFETWAGAVAQILADAVRDPNRLVIAVPKRTSDDRIADRREAETQTMTISDDWSVLRQETFDFARRTYESHR
jgi:hypothetical protein